jgi:thiol-disulfide isomerase/thioredoxin
VGKILAAGEAFPKELKEEYYQRVLAAMREIIDEDKDLNVNNLKETYASFNTLYARGELIGSIAPELDFIWNSAGMELKNLSDLRGKIVIVDFWATWCTPCVRSFPNIRKLQERYKDYPVVFIGVTSIQGRHIDRVNNKTIDTKGDPEKELNLMKVFIKDQNMTWNVAFTKQKVYNPDYGVRGIPHIAIIDTEGKVRYNKINPGSAPYEEAEKIDALLKEAGLKYPTQPMEKRNYAAEAAASTKK